MAGSTSLYIVIACFFAVMFIATIFTKGAAVWPLYFAAAGIALFLVRIYRGDD
ncbi:MAG TPA: hypothetical protein VHB48_08735 [Chitinophagaceae bacterium]|jgi:hypothetical protein|nr:hypothetical protein [Chitinophagaceae bacterium]